MEMVAHSPKAAARVGVPQSVGEDFVAADKDMPEHVRKKVGKMLMERK